MLGWRRALSVQIYGMGISAAGPESSVMSLAPVFDVSGIMMSSVYCNELSNAGYKAGNLTTGPEAPSRKSKKKKTHIF